LPILIRTGPDPFTEAQDSPLILATSDVYYRLRKEIERYARRQTAGRSFLISGHRGAGKTTVVLAAIQDARQELVKADEPLRPLFVRIHGPDLFPDPARKNAAKDEPPKAPDALASSTNSAAALNPLGKAPAAPPPAPEKSAGDPATEGSPPEVVLKQVTIALYRAAAEEFSHSYRDRIEAILSDPFQQAASGPRYSGGHASELFELAAQLRVELDGAPTLDRLRFFWSHLQRLRRGVLFPRSGSPDQGMHELLALSSSAQAYKVVSGRWEEKEASKETANVKSSVALEISQSIKNLVNPAIGLISGGFVAGSKLGDQTNPLIAPLVGVLTGLAVTVALNYSASSSDERNEEREVTFLPDRTISSLDRMLPLLVDRFRRAGLAPVFVVDELDKVDDLEVRMGELVRHLKHFVTERALFCFLTDRDYIEYLAQQAIKDPYPREYTYFSDRLFVFYRPEHLHEYLSRALALEPSADATRAATETVDLELLPFVLLHRSCLHAIDLRREIFRVSNETGHLALAPGALSSTPRYQIDLLIELAVEWVLDQEHVRGRLAQDPEFVQVIFDSLYFASRQWDANVAELKVDEESFRSYLKTRMRLAPQDPLPVGDTDVAFLHDIALQVIRFLMAPDELVSSWQPKKRIPQSALEAVPASEILGGHIEQGILRWRYDRFGRSLEPPDLKTATLRLDRYEAQIKTVTAALTALGGPELDLAALSAGCRILSTSPSWEFVRDALARLIEFRRKISGGSYPDIERDLYAVRTFVVQLERDRETLTLAIAAGALLGNLNSSSIRAGLQVLSDGLKLKEATTQQTRTRIRQIWDSWSGADGLASDITAAFNAEWGIWSISMSALLNRLGSLSDDPAVLDRAEKNAWARWQSQLFGASSTGDSVFVSIDDLTLAAKHRGPVYSLGYDLSTITILQWTDLLLRAGSLLDLVPRSLFDIAVSRLGIDGKLNSLDSNGVAGVLLITPEKDSVAVKWRPSGKHPCFAVPRSRLKDLLQILAQHSTDLQRSFRSINFVLIELVGAPAELASQLKATPEKVLGVDLQPLILPELTYTRNFFDWVVRLFRGRQRPGAWFRYLVPTLPTESAGDRYDYLLAPDSLDDAIRKLRPTEFAASPNLEPPRAS
jgi:hypothetical protein